MKYSNSCRSYMSNKGTKRISPAEPIYQGKYWRVEHAYPCGMRGWLILLPNRHVEAIHEFTNSEMNEFGKIFPNISKSLHKVLKNEKEYVFQLAEGAGFNHVHFHIIAKPKHLPKKYLATDIFKIMSDVKTISKEDAIGFCRILKKEMDKLK